MIQLKSTREIELMAAYGMTPVQALRAATATAAKVLGRSNELGRIGEGALADLVAVRADPLRDVSTLRRPAVVIKDGRLIVDRRADMSTGDRHACNR